MYQPLHPRCQLTLLSRQSFREGAHDIIHDISELTNRDELSKSTLSKAPVESLNSSINASLTSSINTNNSFLLLRNPDSMELAISEDISSFNVLNNTLNTPQSSSSTSSSSSILNSSLIESRTQERMELALIDDQFVDSAPINIVHEIPSSSVVIMSSPVNDDCTGITWIPPNDASIIGEDHRVWTFPGDTFFRDNSTHDSNDSDSSASGCSTSMLFSDTGSNSDDSTEHNPTKQEKKAFKISHPQSLKLTREDRTEKEKAKHNRKDQKLQRFLKVCVR